MAVFKRPMHASQRLPSIGRALQLAVIRGSIVARKWPAKRPHVSEKTANQNEWFRQANWLYKYLSVGQQHIANTVTAGTPLLPRDIFLAASAGRLYSYYLEEEQKEMLPLAVARDVSDSLNALGQTTGDLIVRGPTLWAGLAAGELGHVLTSNGPGEVPSWEPAGGGGGGGGWSLAASVSITEPLDHLDIGPFPDAQALRVALLGVEATGSYYRMLQWLTDGATTLIDDTDYYRWWDDENELNEPDSDQPGARVTDVLDDAPLYAFATLDPVAPQAAPRAWEFGPRGRRLLLPAAPRIDGVRVTNSAFSVGVGDITAGVVQVYTK